MAKQSRSLRKCNKCDGTIGSRWKCQHCDAINPTPEFAMAFVLVGSLVVVFLWGLFSVALG